MTGSHWALRCGPKALGQAEKGNTKPRMHDQSGPDNGPRCLALQNSPAATTSSSSISSIRAVSRAYSGLLRSPWMSKSDINHFANHARPGSHDHDAVGQIHGLVNAVSDENHGLSRLPPDAEQLFLHEDARMGIKGAKGFVHEQDLRVRGQGPRNGHPSAACPRTVRTERPRRIGSCPPGRDNAWQARSAPPFFSCKNSSPRADIVAHGCARAKPNIPEKTMPTSPVRTIKGDAHCRWSVRRRPAPTRK